MDCDTEDAFKWCIYFLEDLIRRCGVAADQRNARVSCCKTTDPPCVPVAPTTRKNLVAIEKDLSLRKLEREGLLVCVTLCAIV
jgi:hypothetical protein